MTGINCTVNLYSDSSGSFYTGNIVTGIVVLELHHEQKIGRIDFEVTGVTKARWTRPRPTIPYVRNYSEKKKVLSVKIEDIFQEIKNGNTMPSGVHRYPFHFSLPEDLPSSCTGSIGKVYYCLKIKSSVSKIRKVVPFNVFANINLNQETELLKPFMQEFQKTLSCSSGVIDITVRTFRAFAPKQIIPIEIIINNQKKVRISKINVMLLQKLRYTVASGYAEEEIKMHKVNYKQIANTTAEICYFNMDMPLCLVPSSLNITDTMINISYVFRIEFIFPFHFTEYEDIPVTVATIPVVHYEF